MDSKNLPVIPLKRFFFIVIIPLLLLVNLIFYWLYVDQKKREIFIFTNRAESSLLAQKKIIEKFADNIFSDLNSILNHHELLSFVNMEQNESQEYLVHDLIQFAKFKGVYDQIRYINEQGMEKIRINFDNGRPVSVKKEKLQNKKNRYYFKDSIKLEKNKIFMSPMDLNIEKGKIELPLKPMIRVGTPVFDKKGKKKGVLLFNYLSRNLLNVLKGEKQTTPHFMMVNKNGYFLKGLSENEEWGFMYENKKHLTFKNKFPDSWNPIASSDKGSFINKLGLFSFNTIFPMKEKAKSSNGASTDFEYSKKVMNADEYQWKIVCFVSKDDFDQKLEVFKKNVVILDVMISFIVIIITWFLAVSSHRKKKNELILFQFLEAIPVGIFVMDANTGIPYYANQMSKEILGQGIVPQDSIDNLDTVYKAYIVGTNQEYPIGKMPITKALSGKSISISDMEIHRIDDKVLLHVTASPVLNENGSVAYAIAAFVDISAQMKMELELNHVRKLEAVGQLAAGIAHEINTPAQYIGDNTNFLKESFSDLLKMIEAYESFRIAEEEGSVTPKMLDQLEEKIDETDVKYLLEEIPTTLDQSLDGIKKISQIVHAMKAFSHPGKEAKVYADINSCLECTITVSRAEWKYVADLRTDLAQGLPMIPCYPSELNQVFLNVIINGAHAIDEKQTSEGNTQKGTITVSTLAAENHLEIRIQDTGAGVPDHIKTQIFDPFFTTKEIGKGTGQGLAIANSIVVDKHGGKLSFESQEGSGTAFIIQLPLEVKEDTTDS